MEKSSSVRYFKIFKTLEKYFFKKYFVWFLIFYIGINALVILLEFLGHIDLFLKDFSKFYEAYKKYLYLTFPIVIYFSIYFFFSEIKQSKEYIVVQSLGINFFQVLKIIFLFLFFIVVFIYIQSNIYNYDINKIILLISFSILSAMNGLLIGEEKDFSGMILGFVIIFSFFNIFSSLSNFHIIDTKVLLILMIILILTNFIIFVKIYKKKGYI